MMSVIVVTFEDDLPECAFTNLEAAKRYALSHYGIPLTDWHPFTVGLGEVAYSVNEKKLYLQEILIVDSTEYIDSVVANRCKGIIETRWDETIPFPMDNNL